MSVHPDGQRPQATQHEPAVKWAGHATDRILMEPQLLGQLIVIDYKRPADDPRVIYYPG